MNACNVKIYIQVYVKLLSPIYYYYFFIEHIVKSREKQRKWSAQYNYTYEGDGGTDGCGLTPTEDVSWFLEVEMLAKGLASTLSDIVLPP